MRYDVALTPVLALDENGDDMCVPAFWLNYSVSSERRKSKDDDGMTKSLSQEKKKPSPIIIFHLSKTFA